MSEALPEERRSELQDWPGQRRWAMAQEQQWGRLAEPLTREQG